MPEPKELKTRFCALRVGNAAPARRAMLGVGELQALKPLINPELMS